MNSSNLRTAVKGVAAFEAIKGLAALAGLMGLLRLLHHDLHHLALELIGHMGLSVHQHYPELLLSAADTLNATPIHTVVLVGLGYAATRFIEAWGLWHDKAWGEWFGALACGIYIPFEVRHVLQAPHWQGMAVLAVNAALMAVLLVRLNQRRRVRTA